MRGMIWCGIGAIGGVIASALGGWDVVLRTLFVLIAVDYVTGLLLAGVFKRSKKSESGALDSRIGFKGIAKKVVMLLMVVVGYHLDYVIGWDFIRHAVIIALIVNELISIIENAGLMGVPVPHVLREAIGVLKKKGGEG